MTIALPPFLMLTSYYLDGHFTWRRRVFWVPMAVLEILGMILAIPCVRRTEDYYPTVVLWSMYVGCVGTCLSWLPVCKQLGIKVIWSKASSRKWATKVDPLIRQASTQIDHVEDP